MLPTPLRHAAALGLALLLLGCGGDDDAANARPYRPAADGSAADAPAGEAGKQGVQERPVIAKKTGEPPTKLAITDLVKGTGAEAVARERRSKCNTSARSSATGEEFDASWNSGQPFAFQLGAGMVIAGWDEGVAGMKVGGRRELVIPARPRLRPERPGADRAERNAGLRRGSDRGQQLILAPPDGSANAPRPVLMLPAHGKCGRHRRGWARVRSEAGQGGGPLDQQAARDGATKKGRTELGRGQPVSVDALILKWVNHADLIRIRGIGPEFAELLEAAGTDSVPELARRNAANLRPRWRR